METHITGPPVQLRPHIRQRRLPMGYVRESEARYQKQKADRGCGLEDEYARLALEAERQRRSDFALERLANLVAALLCAEWRPPLTLATEPARMIGAGETDNRK